MKTWQTKAEIHSEVWVGGQVERVVALLAERDFAREALKSSASGDSAWESAARQYRLAALAAREEQRESDACRAADYVEDADLCSDCRDEVSAINVEILAMPLAGALLRDRIAELELAVEDHDAERGELRHRIADLEADEASWERVATEQQDRAMRAEKYRDAELMAVAERVREACALSLFTCKDHSLAEAIEANISCAKQEDMAKVRATPLAALVKGGGR